MKREPAITAEGVTKKFILHGGTRTIKSAALDILKSGARRQGREFWAVRDVTFEVARGETLGIIGANGAGKSTLLALVAGTMQPTSGRITTRGTISSLLELGAGFHPDLSGRENVYLAGAIMGLTKQQMTERFDSIVDFAELAEYIDEPVKHYSSGMYVRLGFAVAVEVNPDILLVDEVLAVGDAVFERKCIQRMEQFRKEGKTMLLISHDMRTIQLISDRIMLLDQGRVIETGQPSDVVKGYQKRSELRHREGLRKEWGTRDLTITRIAVFDSAGQERHKFRWDEEVVIQIHYDAAKPVPSPVFGFSIGNEQGRILSGNNCQVEGTVLPDLLGTGHVQLRIPRLNISKGIYLLSFSAHSQDHMVNYHRLDNCFPIEVIDDKGFAGVYLPSSWAMG